MAAKQEPPENIPIKLQITLENVPLSVSRVVLVPDFINMEELHVIIQVAMGWQFAHLFRFCDKKYNPTIVVSDEDWIDDEDQNEEDKDDNDEDDPFDFILDLDDELNSDGELFPEGVLLKEEFMIRRERKSFYYWYNFGEDWCHKITFQEPTRSDIEAFNGMPVCIDAVGACPPEDCGGPWGYSELIEAIVDRRNTEYEQVLERVDQNQLHEFNPDHADKDQINGRFHSFFA